MPSTTPHPDDFQVAAPARLQIDRLTDNEKRRLTRLLTSARSATGSNTKRTASGHFISRLSTTKRVLWTTEDGRPKVLSIADRSYSVEQ